MESTQTIHWYRNELARVVLRTLDATNGEYITCCKKIQGMIIQPKSNWAEVNFQKIKELQDKVLDGNLKPHKIDAPAYKDILSYPDFKHKMSSGSAFKGDGSIWMSGSLSTDTFNFTKTHSWIAGGSTASIRLYCAIPTGNLFVDPTGDTAANFDVMSIGDTSRRGALPTSWVKKVEWKKVDGSYRSISIKSKDAIYEVVARLYKVYLANKTALDSWKISENGWIQSIGNKYKSLAER